MGENEIVDLLDGLVQAAEATARQASGNDQADWHNFALALRKLREEWESQPKR